MRTSELFEEEVRVTHGELAAFASAIEAMGYTDVDYDPHRVVGHLGDARTGHINSERVPCPGEIEWKRDGRFRFIPYEDPFRRPIMVFETGSPHDRDPVLDDMREAARVAQRIIAATSFTPADLGLKRGKGYDPCWVPYDTDDLRHNEDGYGELGFFYHYTDDTYEAWIVDDDQRAIARGPDLQSVVKTATETLRRKYPSQFPRQLPQRR